MNSVSHILALELECNDSWLNEIDTDPSLESTISYQRKSDPEVDRDSVDSSLSFSPWSSADEASTNSDTENDQDASNIPPRFFDCCNDAERLIDRLIDLGVVIRQSGMSSRLLRADSTFNEHLYTHLRRHLELQLQLSNLRASILPDIREKDQTAEGDIKAMSLTMLRPEQVHLIHLNLRRRHRFAFARKRASTLAFPQAVDEPILARNENLVLARMRTLHQQILIEIILSLSQRLYQLSRRLQL